MKEVIISPSFLHKVLHPIFFSSFIYFHLFCYYLAGDMVDVTLSEGFNRIFNLKTSRKGKVISVTSMREVVENAIAKSEAIPRYE